MVRFTEAFLKEVLRIDRSQITAFQAIRGTIGIVIPLAIGVASGHVVEGVSMAGDAAIVATVGLNTTSRVRTRTMLLDCVGVALAAFVGSITGHIGWLSVLVVGIWGISFTRPGSWQNLGNTRINLHPYQSERFLARHICI